uniref:Uncharacterized protein n=1 Tax=Nelumbo nucifera TaxID=4432 RepID=A0A822XJQ0_NELNU|nr:TPA_asm: hypothetical protein HUJ06_021695 [Nelumbo nucifera]
MTKIGVPYVTLSFVKCSTQLLLDDHRRLGQP